MGRGVHMGWSEAGTFVFRVFLVQGCPVLNLLGKPWSAVPASVGARSRARGRGPGGSDAVSYAYKSLVKSTLCDFRLDHLEFATRRRPPRASRRGLRAGPPD